MLRTPRDVLDVEIGHAAGADIEAQRWLGWSPERVLDARIAEHLLGIDDRCRVERLRGFPVSVRRQLTRHFVADGKIHWLLVIDAASDRIAGQTALDTDAGTIGFWLAPAYRHQGLGAELVESTARFAHDHLGLESVRAGTETANKACRRALSAAGFAPCEGPAEHSLPDGRTVAAAWYQHVASGTSFCTVTQSAVEDAS